MVKRFGFNIKNELSMLMVYALVVMALLFISLPVLSLFLKTSPDAFINSMESPVVLDALKLSFITSLTTAFIVIVVGTPIAYMNARYKYRGKVIVDTIIDLPVVIPPAVAGIALLMAFGRMGVVGQYLNMAGITVGFTIIAVIMAQTFVAAPFYIRQARTSFEDVDRSMENAARTLGASRLSTFFFITVPIAMNGLISGIILTWARALGEFGATILFAGNFEGRTQTMPLAIYVTMESDLNAAIAISIVLVVISFIVIAAVKLLTRSVSDDARS